MERDFLKEAREFADRGLWAMNSLHIGPLDYNVTAAADHLRTAASLLEEHLRQEEAA